MDTNRMRNINNDISRLYFVAGKPDIRQIRRNPSWNKGILGNFKAWAMRFHYFMWIVAIFTVFTATLIFRGQQDILLNSARAEGVSVILKELSPEQLTDINI